MAAGIPMGVGTEWVWGFQGCGYGMGLGIPIGVGTGWCRDFHGCRYGMAVGIPMGVGIRDGCGDYNQSPQAYGNSMGILSGCKFKWKRFIHGVNVIVDI